MDAHQSERYDPYLLQGPHQCNKLDPDPHHSDKLDPDKDLQIFEDDKPKFMKNEPTWAPFSRF